LVGRLNSRSCWLNFGLSIRLTDLICFLVLRCYITVKRFSALTLTSQSLKNNTDWSIKNSELPNYSETYDCWLLNVFVFTLGIFNLIFIKKKLYLLVKNIILSIKARQNTYSTNRQIYIYWSYIQRIPYRIDLIVRLFNFNLFLSNF